MKVKELIKLIKDYPDYEVELMSSPLGVDEAYNNLVCEIDDQDKIIWLGYT